MIKTINPNDIPFSEVYTYLSSAIAPRPICFASTIDSEGNVNLSPFSFFNVFSANPPIMVFSPVRSGRDGSLKHTHQNIKEIPEVVINIVNHPMVEQMSLASTAYEKGINEFTKAGFTEIKSEIIRPPRVAESPVSFECTVQNIIELDNTPGAGNLIIAKVERIHIHKIFLNKENKLDTTKLDLVGRMGENWYIRANKNALFEIPKPTKTIGIGIDALPKHIKNSTVLTGNNLGRLGTLKNMPSKNEIDAAKKTIEHYGISNDNDLHQFAKDVLNQGDTIKALAILCAR